MKQLPRKLTKNSTAEIGVLGEKIAEKFLKSKGFAIVARNYRQKWGEIDIIAENDTSLRFVEVKAMAGTSFMPEEHVHREKLKRLFRTIDTYLGEKGEREREWQLDVVAVTLDLLKKTASVRFTENVFLE